MADAWPRMTCTMPRTRYRSRQFAEPLAGRRVGEHAGQGFLASHWAQVMTLAPSRLAWVLAETKPGRSRYQRPDDSVVTSHRTRPGPGANSKTLCPTKLARART